MGGGAWIVGGHPRYTNPPPDIYKKYTIAIIDFKVCYSAFSNRVGNGSRDNRIDVWRYL